MAALCVPDSSSCTTLCGECGKELETHCFVHIVEIDQVVNYVVPSFPVFEAALQHIKYCLVEEEDKGLIYDGFIRAKDPCTVESGCILRLCRCYSSAFFINYEEFRKSVDIANYTLFDSNTKVFVIWKWDRMESNYEESEYEHSSSDMFDEVKHSSEEETKDCAPESVYTVTFKCIGTTKEHRYQEILAEAALNRRNGMSVEFRISLEPNNAFDARAIAFECCLNNKWERVGYMVTDVLSAVHEAWSRSSPGWYCGVSIGKKGPQILSLT